jgi:lipid II:glycine glycyltransferase (peptidoglycan interpeptide bridge formation enzyme)
MTALPPQVHPHTSAGLTVEAPPPARWDRFCATHRDGHLLQSSAWGALKRDFGWASRLVAVQDATGALVAGAHLLVRRAYGLAAAYVPRGPLLASDSRANEALLATLVRMARRERAVLLRFEPNLVEDDARAAELHTWLQLHGFRPAESLQPRSSVHVELRRSEQELLAALSKGHRADIRRAERAGLTVREGSSDADLATFFALMQETGRRAGFAIHSQDYYRRAWRALQATEPFGGATLLLAEHEGRAVAAFLILAWGREACYLYSGAHEAGLKSGANHLLQWQVLRWAITRGCERYDLWGVPDQFGRMRALPAEQRGVLEAQAKADPLYGVYRFKKGFAGEVVRYLPAYDYVFWPWLYPLVRRRLG